MSSMIMSLLAPDVSAVEKVLRTLMVYGALLVLLRLAGKRELGQLNALDLVVLLLLSNTLQNALVGNDLSVSGGLLGAATLLAVNALVVRLLYRNRRLDRLVEGEPEELIRHGRIVRQRLAQNLITEEELAAAARRQGIASLSDVETCWLEVGGTLSFVAADPDPHDRRHRELLSRLDRLEREFTSNRPPASPPPHGDPATA